MNEDKLLIRIAEMYYQEDKNQSQIAKELSIHRSTISRLLKKSREEGIVQVTINYDKDESYALEKRLMAQFNLEHAIIVRASSEMKEEQRLALIAKATDEYLTSILADHQLIGFSWGGTLASFVNNMQPKHYEGITCLPLIGGPAGRLISDYHVNTITYEAAKKLGGRALLIDAPAFPESKEMKEALMKNQFNQQLTKLWQKIDIAVFGIGSPDLSGKQTWQDFYGKAVLEEVTEQEIAGDVISRFYNIQGKSIVSKFDERIIGTSLKDLMQIETRIGIAESTEKAQAILGALRGNYLNVLATTDETAQEILALAE